MALAGLLDPRNAADIGRRVAEDPAVDDSCDVGAAAYCLKEIIRSKMADVRSSFSLVYIRRTSPLLSKM